MSGARHDEASRRPSAEVLAVVLNWRAYDETVGCAEAALASSDAAVRLLVVDGASPDGSGERLAERFGAERVLRLPENRGYAGGMNAGLERWLARDGPEYAVLLTQDARLAPTALARMVDAMERTPSAAIVGPVVRERGAAGRILSAGRVLEPRSARERHLPRPRSGTPYAVDGVDGCCMLLRRSAVRELGGFDPRYFMYFEETDLCQRARDRGWTVLVAPDAGARHSAGPLARPPYYYYYMARNRLLFWRENFGLGLVRAGSTTARATLGIAGSALKAAVLPRRRHEGRARLRQLGRQVRGALAGTRDHLRGRYGRMPVRASRAESVGRAAVGGADGGTGGGTGGGTDG